jgi:hypothetical protein
MPPVTVADAATCSGATPPVGSTATCTDSVGWTSMARVRVTSLPPPSVTTTMTSYRPTASNVWTGAASEAASDPSAKFQEYSYGASPPTATAWNSTVIGTAPSVADARIVTCSG